MKVDVVIPTKGEETLKQCINSAKRHIPVNRLILVAPTDITKKIAPLADIVVSFDEANIGKARKKGLELVETEIYASIDSDVLISPYWFKWCFDTIQNPSVAACQGYAKPIAKIYGRSEERWLHTKPIIDGVPRPCDLGNTMLKTDIVRQVGMSPLRVKEDLELYRRMQEIGYRWVINVNLVSMHLKTDIDIWKHAIQWHKMGGDSSLKAYVRKAFCRGTRLTYTKNGSQRLNIFDMAVLFSHDWVSIILGKLLG